MRQGGGDGWKEGGGDGEGRREGERNIIRQRMTDRWTEPLAQCVYFA